MFKSKYNHDFLKTKIKSILDKKYAPIFHIWPNKGLLNDPNCIFYYKKNLYVMFQHHPQNPEHGLKSMSLAKTNNFYKFNYHYLVNQPDSKFDYDGVYSGNALLFNKKIVMMYSGNTYHNNGSERLMHVVKANYNLKTNKTVNKKSILTSKDYCNKYTSHFRDPYIFVYKNKNYMLLGAQDKFLKGTILLFSLDKNFDHPYLIKEIKLADNNYMIECPNILFNKSNAYLIYCPQYSKPLNKNQNLNLVFYSHIKTDILFDKSSKALILKNKTLVDYGPEFYAPQIFKINKSYFLIAWAGRSDSLKYYEVKNGWIHMLTCIRKISFINSDLCFAPINSWKNQIQKSKNRKVKYFELILKTQKTLLIKDGQTLVFEIKLIKKTIFIKRFNFNSYFPCKTTSKIKVTGSFKNIISIFLDHSIIEIWINNKIWYTSRIYINEELNFYEK